MRPHQRNGCLQATSHDLFGQAQAAGHQTRGQLDVFSAGPPSRTEGAPETAPEVSTNNALHVLQAPTSHSFNEGDSKRTRAQVSSLFPGVPIGTMTNRLCYGPSSQIPGNLFAEGFTRSSVDIANITKTSSKPLNRAEFTQDPSESRFSNANVQTNICLGESHSHQLQAARDSACHSSLYMFREPSVQNQQVVQRAIGATDEGNVEALERFMVGEVELQQENEFNSANMNCTEGFKTSLANLGLGNNPVGRNKGLAPVIQRQPFGPTVNSVNNFGLFRNQNNSLSTALALPGPFLEHRFDGNMAVIQRPSSFQPSDMLTRLRTQAYFPQSQGPPKMDNRRYQGDSSSRSYNNQVPGLQDELNCALWLTNISPTVTVADMFDIIDCGSVAALYINRPDIEHAYSAAKLIFKEASNARQFYLRPRIYGMWLHGRRVQVKYNRNGHLRWEGPQTRVLRVDGPDHLMTLEYWGRFFRNICVFEGDRALYIGSSSPGRKTMEFRFDRIDGQAQMCLGGILDRYDSDEVRAWYGPDPCDPASRSLFIM